ncbi:MAG TPA: hypothetical protein VN798_10400, partial [Pseudomonas sp.]|nr:hypothetical protein [Pseudomonas sp.]
SDQATRSFVGRACPQRCRGLIMNASLHAGLPMSWALAWVLFALVRQTPARAGSVQLPIP